MLSRAAVILSMSVLVAQTPFYERRAMPVREPNLRQLRGEVARSGGCLLLKPSMELGLQQRARDLLRQPPLDDLEVVVRAVVPGSKIAQELEPILNHEGGSTWALVDAEFKVLCQGRTFPSSPEVLAAQFRAAGWRTALDVLEEFLRRNPHRLDAQGRRIGLLSALARRRLEPLVVDPKSRDLQRPLTQEEDERIFGPLVRALDALLRDSAWMAVRWIPWTEDLRHSRLAAEIAKRHFPSVDGALRGLPENLPLWQLWMGISRLVPGASALGILQAQPSAMKRLPSLQPWVLEALVKDARHRGALKDLVPLLQKDWDSNSSPALFRFSFPDFRRTWTHSAGALAEGLLRLGRPREAGEVVSEFMEWSGCGEASVWAADLAKVCGYTRESQAWARLRPSADAGRLLRGLPKEDLKGGWGIRTSPAGLEGASWADRLRFEGLQRGEVKLVRLEEVVSEAARGAWKPGTSVPPPWIGTPDLEAWQGAWRALNLVLEPRALDLGILIIGLDTPAAKELLAREGWDGRRRWVLSNGSGRVLSHGTEVPSADTLETLVRAHGHIPVAEQTRQALKEQPDHLECLINRYAQVLVRIRQVGQNMKEAISMRRRREEDTKFYGGLRDPVLRERGFLEIEKRLGTEAAKRSRAQTMEILKRLEEPLPAMPADDQEGLWAEAVDLLERILAQPAWPANETPVSLPESAGASEAFRHTAPRLLSIVEDVLVKAPACWEAWRLWAELAALTGASPTDFVAQIPPLPGQRHACPNHDALTKTLVAQKRWGEIEAWVVPLREAWEEEPDHEMRSEMFQGAEALMEAHLALGMVSRAEGLVEELVKATPRAAYRVLFVASGVAQRTNHKELAEAWEKRARLLIAAKTPQS